MPSAQKPNDEHHYNILVIVIVRIIMSNPLYRVRGRSLEEIKYAFADLVKSSTQLNAECCYDSIVRQNLWFISNI